MRLAPIYYRNMKIIMDEFDKWMNPTMKTHFVSFFCGERNWCLDFIRISVFFLLFKLSGKHIFISIAQWDRINSYNWCVHKMHINKRYRIKFHSKTFFIPHLKTLFFVWFHLFTFVWVSWLGLKSFYDKFFFFFNLKYILCIWSNGKHNKIEYILRIRNRFCTKTNHH